MKTFDESQEKGIELFGTKWLRLNDIATTAASIHDVNYRDQKVRAFISELLLAIGKELTEPMPDWNIIKEITSPGFNHIRITEKGFEMVDPFRFVHYGKTAQECIEKCKSSIERHKPNHAIHNQTK